MTTRLKTTRTFLAATALLAALPVFGAMAQDGAVARVGGQEITERDLAVAEAMYGQHKADR